MRNSVNVAVKAPRSFRPTVALAHSVEYSDDMLHVSLTDGRIVSVPLVWFSKLLNATLEQRLKYEIGGHWVGLHWPDLDEDLLVAGLLSGGDE